MDRDLGVPIQHIPPSVLKEVALHLDIGTEHTWESLAECMDLDAATVSVRFFGLNSFVICLLPSLLSSSSVI